MGKRPLGIQPPPGGLGVLQLNDLTFWECPSDLEQNERNIGAQAEVSATGHPAAEHHSGWIQCRRPIPPHPIHPQRSGGQLGGDPVVASDGTHIWAHGQPVVGLGHKSHRPHQSKGPQPGEANPSSHSEWNRCDAKVVAPDISSAQAEHHQADHPDKGKLTDLSMG
jgi:hypothetical protein